jgi:hypothetical protein
MYRPTGKRVEVIDLDTGHVLFTGHRANIGPPWMFWNRIIPDQPYIDLPPKYKVVERKEEENGSPE